MKNGFVAGLLAACLSAAIFTIPAQARCENARCAPVVAKHLKTVTAKARSPRVKVRFAVVAKAATAAKKARIATARKAVIKTRVAKAKIDKVSKIHIASISPDEIAKISISKTGSVRHTFNAPLRKRPAIAGLAPAPSAPAKQTAGGGSVVAMIRLMAPQYGVPTWFALRIAKVESGYNPNARGLAGELGVFQMKCATARGIGYRGDCTGLLNARTGVQYGLKHLSIALKSSRGNLKLAASKHNGGLGRKSLVLKYVAQVF